MRVACVQLVGKFSNEAQNICIVDNVIYNFTTDQFDYKSSIETYDISRKKFDNLWEKNTDDFDFSPYYSSGCFPVVIYPNHWKRQKVQVNYTQKGIYF